MLCKTNGRCKCLQIGKIINDIREETTEYQLEAIREVIINAMVHRDYAKLGTQVDVFIYDDRIEIGSVGRPLGETSIEQISQMRFPSSERRNKKLADVLSRLKYMERSGTEFIRIKEYYRNDIENVEFIQEEDFVHVVFRSRTYIQPPKYPSSRNLKTI
ncbi:MAG: hypothetical protein JJE21_08790 [Spirochaetaceae bacterium]|nr:hypothetical protein [Spirochaetaceae bacterium]